VTAKSTQKTIKTIFLSTFKKIILKTKPKKKKRVFSFKITVPLPIFRWTSIQSHRDLRIGIKRRRILGVLIQKIKTHRGC
jgi:hypothetical protein